jgi:hypothetical protein
MGPFKVIGNISREASMGPFEVVGNISREEVWAHSLSPTVFLMQ